MRECKLSELSSQQRELLRAAKAARKHAYSPYSGHKVGAAVRSGSGKIYSACNVELVSLSQSIHAERHAVMAMAAGGERRLVQVAVYGQYAGIPCAECRQALWEFCGNNPDTEVVAHGVAAHEVDAPVRVFSLGELYPWPYGPETKNVEPGDY